MWVLARRVRIDAYQVLLLMASHSGRHTAQIREVEADPKFPKDTARLLNTGEVSTY